MGGVWGIDSFSKWERILGLVSTTQRRATVPAMADRIGIRAAAWKASRHIPPSPLVDGMSCRCRSSQEHNDSSDVAHSIYTILYQLLTELVLVFVSLFSQMNHQIFVASGM